MAPDSSLRWTPARPNALVVACSDGRLQEATDAFLAREFKITRYDRFYILTRRREWASDAGVLLYRCEVNAAGLLTFVNLDPDSALGSERPIRGAVGRVT